MGDLILNLLLMGGILLAIYGVGHGVRRLIRIDFGSRALELAFALAFGLGTITTLLFMVGLLGWLRPLVGWLILAVGLILTAFHYQTLLSDLKRAREVLRRTWSDSWLAKGLMLLGLGFLILNLIADLALPLEGDTTHQYLVVVRDWVDAGRYYQPTHIWAASLPGNIQMLSAWALLLRSNFGLAGLVSGFGMSLFLALAVYALARTLVGSRAAMFAALLIYTMPDTSYLAQSAKVDMGWAFFEALALVAFLRGLDQSDEDGSWLYHHRWLILSGLCLGWAAGSKNQTFISVALLSIWLIIHHIAAHRGKGLVQAALIFGLSVILTGFPYYLYNAVTLGNPFYPVFASQFTDLFGAVPSPRSELGTEVYYPWSVGGYLTNLWNASLGHPPDFYLGFIAGPAFLLLIPVGLILGLFKGQRRLWQILLYAAAFSVIWFLVKQAARHFLPGLILLAMLSGYILTRLEAQTPRIPRALISASILIALGGSLINIAAIVYANQTWRVALGIDTQAEHLAHWHDAIAPANFPDSALLAELNTTLTRSDRILTNHAASPLYITPQIVSFNWGDRIPYELLTDDDQLLDALADHHIEYLLVYDQPAPVDLIFEDPEFLAAHTELIYDGQRARLYDIIER